jgi:hypothetical protein
VKSIIEIKRNNSVFDLILAEKIIIKNRNSVVNSCKLVAIFFISENGCFL